MAHRLITALFALGLVAAPAAAQGLFLRLSPQFDLLQESYDSPWTEYITFDRTSSYGIGADVGFIFQPRRLAIQIRVSSGVHYQFAEIAASVKLDGRIDSGYIVNESFEEAYEFLKIPVTIELLYASRSSRLSPGIYLSYINTFIKRSAGESTLFDGSVQSYDIPIRSYVQSAAAGAFVDVILSRRVNLELAAGYTHMFGNILKDTEARLSFHTINLKGGIIIKL